MVERPIKKSERLAKAASDEAHGSSEANSAPVKEPRTKDRGKGRAKKGGRRDQEEPKQAVNPALVRGPKPVKAPPPKEPVAEEAITEVVEEADVEQSESAELAQDVVAEA